MMKQTGAVLAAAFLLLSLAGCSGARAASISLPDAGSMPAAVYRSNAPVVSAAQEDDVATQQDIDEDAPAVAAADAAPVLVEGFALMTVADTREGGLAEEIALPTDMTQYYNGPRDQPDITVPQLSYGKQGFSVDVFLYAPAAYSPQQVLDEMTAAQRVLSEAVEGYTLDAFETETLSDASAPVSCVRVTYTLKSLADDESKYSVQSYLAAYTGSNAVVGLVFSASLEDPQGVATLQAAAAQYGFYLA